MRKVFSNMQIRRVRKYSKIICNLEKQKSTEITNLIVNIYYIFQ